MSLNSWISNLINSEIDLSEQNLFRLKSSVSELNSVLKDIYDTSKPGKVKKTYSGLVSQELLQSKKLVDPELFYTFLFDNKSVCITVFKSKLWVKVTGFNIPRKHLQYLLDSDLFNTVNLYTPQDLVDSKVANTFKDLDSLDSTFFGSWSVDIVSLNECVQVYKHCCNYLINNL